jgi:type IV secretion system protein VirB3
MHEPQERLTEDILYLACTRPAMVLGAPMEAVGVNIIATAIAFLAGHSLGWLAIAPALQLVFQAICKSDHNAFRVLWLFLETRGRARNVALWGGSSISPLPMMRPALARSPAHA